jgi:hypothetical protein
LHSEAVAEIVEGAAETAALLAAREVSIMAERVTSTAEVEAFQADEA